MVSCEIWLKTICNTKGQSVPPSRGGGRAPGPRLGQVLVRVRVRGVQFPNNNLLFFLQMYLLMEIGDIQRVKWGAVKVQVSMYIYIFFYQQQWQHPTIP